MRRSGKSRLILGLGAAAAAMLTLPGCSSSFGYAAYSGNVTSTDVLGRWMSSCGASLDVASSGKLTAATFPTAWSASGNPTRTYTGTGTWWLYDAPQGGGASGFNVSFKDYGYTLDYASVHGKLGFAYDILYHDATGLDEEFCIFTRPPT